MLKKLDWIFPFKKKKTIINKETLITKTLYSNSKLGHMPYSDPYMSPYTDPNMECKGAGAF